MSWVIDSVVAPTSFTVSTIRSLMMSAMIGSRPVVGSSKKMISGIGGDGARQADALLHAAGEFGRRKLRDLGAEPDLGELFDRDVARLAARHAAALDQAERDVLPDGQAVEQRRALEQHAEFAQHRGRARGRAGASPPRRRRRSVRRRGAGCRARI